MYEYFKMLKAVADTDTTEYTIKDLTIALAMSGGYHRDLYTFDCGTQRVRTMYTKPFDNVLTAKWLMFYKPLFVSKLCKHPEFTQYQSQIINRTFFITMNSLNLDKLTDDDIINKYVNLALNGRICEVLNEMGSAKRLKEYEDTGKRNLTLKNITNSMSISIDESYNDFENMLIEHLDEYSSATAIADLDCRLSKMPFGDRVMTACMDSSKQINLSRIDDFIILDDDEKTEETKIHIANALNVIKNIMKAYDNSRHMHDYSLIKSNQIHYTDEGK